MVLSMQSALRSRRWLERKDEPIGSKKEVQSLEMEALGRPPSLKEVFTFKGYTDDSA